MSSPMIEAHFELSNEIPNKVITPPNIKIKLRSDNTFKEFSITIDEEDEEVSIEQARAVTLANVITLKFGIYITTKLIGRSKTEDRKKFVRSDSIQKYKKLRDPGKNVDLNSIIPSLHNNPILNTNCYHYALATKSLEDGFSEVAIKELYLIVESDKGKFNNLLNYKYLRDALSHSNNINYDTICGLNGKFPNIYSKISNQKIDYNLDEIKKLLYIEATRFKKDILRILDLIL
jgi:hypothetical protein